MPNSQHGNTLFFSLVVKKRNQLLRLFISFYLSLLFIIIIFFFFNFLDTVFSNYDFFSEGERKIFHGKMVLELQKNK